MAVRLGKKGRREKMARGPRVREREEGDRWGRGKGKRERGGAGRLGPKWAGACGGKKWARRNRPTNRFEILI